MPHQSQRTAPREQILEAALRILEAEGPVNFRLQTLAESLGVTIPALYRHFKDRDDIIKSAYTEAFSREAAASVALARLITESNFDATMLLRLLVEQLSSFTSARYQRERLTRMEALTTTIHDENTQQRIAQLMRQVHDATTEAVESLQRRGVFRLEFNPAAFSIVLRSVVAGLIVWDMDESLDVPVEDVRQVIEHVVRQFLIG